MNLKEQITEDMKKYMKEKNSLSLAAVRMLKSDIKNAEISSMKELDDEAIVKVVQSGIKKRKDSIEMYNNAGRKDLAEKEKSEIIALEKYLPAQLSHDEIKIIVKETILELNNETNFGIVMKGVVAKVGSRGEGKVVSSIVKDILNGNS